jgi:arylamine N-acetyltransferase
VDLDEQLGFWEEGTAGGVCFERTAMFGRLLEDLGYQAHTTLADASFPKSHQALVVSFPDGDFLADVGNGAPFYYPVPIRETSEVRHVGLVYRFRPGDRPHELVQERLINGAWSLFCTYDLRDPGAKVLEQAYQRHHRPGESWVMDEFRLVRCTQEDVRAYRSGQFTHYTSSGKRSEKLTDPASVVRMAVEEFGLPWFRVGETLSAQAGFARALAPG